MNIAPVAGGLFSIQDELRHELLNPNNGWSMGVFGALAEFSHFSANASVGHAPFTAINSAGAVRLSLPPQTSAYAFEALSARSDSWQHGIVFGLPPQFCDKRPRAVLTEVGPDRAAIRPQDRDGLLFDLGLGMHSCDFHVRSDDPATISHLRKLCGLQLFGNDISVLMGLITFQPHRVVSSPLGRIEIFQRIPLPGEPTPEGPHTHLLPDLVRRRRINAADLLIPIELTPCLTLHPPNPVSDAHGKSRQFDAGAFMRFQYLFDRFGDPSLVQLKRQVWSCIRKGDSPKKISLASRSERIACRVALRQLAHIDGVSSALAT